MKDYSVVIIKPDYNTGEWSNKCAVMHIVAQSVQDAKILGQTAAKDTDLSDTGAPVNGRTEDYHVLCVIAGHCLVEYANPILEEAYVS